MQLKLSNSIVLHSPLNQNQRKQKLISCWPPYCSHKLETSFIGFSL